MQPEEPTTEVPIENKDEEAPKYLDMPSIDDHDVAKSEDFENYHGTNGNYKPKYHEIGKKYFTETKQEKSQNVEKGIESVVEKLKKNVTTHQENDAKSQEPVVTGNNCPRKLENGLKKLILRSCENSLEKISMAYHQDENNVVSTSAGCASSDEFCCGASVCSDNNNVEYVDDKEKSTNRIENEADTTYRDSEPSTPEKGHGAGHLTGELKNWSFQAQD